MRREDKLNRWQQWFGAARGEAARSTSFLEAFVWCGIAAASFQIASYFLDLSAVLVLYGVGLWRIARLPSSRGAFYIGLLLGFVSFAGQLGFFWRIFGPAAVLLWLVLGFWTGLFAGVGARFRNRHGFRSCLFFFPVAWMGIEYFRSELYYLKFSWLTLGSFFVESRLWGAAWLGMYGVGAVVILMGGCLACLRGKRLAVGCSVAIVLFGILREDHPTSLAGTRELHVGGVQLEFPATSEVLNSLSELITERSDLDLIVLCEYTFESPPPESVRRWCRENQMYLVVGGKDPLGGGRYHNTVFVIDPKGEIVFKQAKSAPIQFFDDGEPAVSQQIWDSPWGKIGLCICYDLSFTRVTDELVRQGAELLIVPTMDVVEWGEREHNLHASIAPIRAAEYRVPVFRLASSGISQAVDSYGRVVNEAPFPGQGAMIFDRIQVGGGGRLPVDRAVGLFAVWVTIAGVVLCFFVGNTRS